MKKINRNDNWSFINKNHTNYQQKLISEQKKQQHVTNYFEKFDLAADEEMKVKEGYYSTFDTIEVLLNNPESEKVVLKYFDAAFEHPKFNTMKEIMTIEKMAMIKNAGIPQELLSVINKELSTIKKRNI